MEYDRWIICIYLILIIVCATIKTTRADKEIQNNESSVATASPKTNSTKKLISQKEKIQATYKDCAGLEVCQILNIVCQKTNMNDGK